MRYFNYLQPEEESRIFHIAPSHFTNRTPKEVLAFAVGAALYMPATRASIVGDIMDSKIKGLTSMVIDLEDAVGDHQVEQAEASMLDQIYRLYSMMKLGAIQEESIPLIFIRVRSPQQLKRIITIFEETTEMITGFMLPKFSLSNGQQYLEIIQGYNHTKRLSSPTLYGLPILESAEVIYKEERYQTLSGLRQLITQYQDYILNIRIGATDFSSLFGLRRSPDMTIYDISVIRDCITDIINFFGRAEDGHVISGPVWEYFKSDRVLKPQLRQTLFEETAGRVGRKRRMEILNVYVDGLIREVAMDKENGIIGKTIIHPTHILPVQSMYVVTHEEYMDALSIIDNNTGMLGVFKSKYSNKMNEIKPHLNWAQRMMARSQVYGVLHENINFTTLLLGDKEHEQILI
ncbi:HpcH/HpaI aldolase/citrate lyase family protein [Paenibacillus sp. P96]|uniref:HpcH/HpaI aldolase/citrate lyase family protein n=1 Tax=Paenibacillus zeirhizosphaerae TaxID=2987519 RepID=A0ABT9FTJ7_9BACL|nr:HpcH/HpaI aldolase/citrate lyase family protein [Paenibacillus sp. P96]MDP4098054.1 HpcH/HpaI aldolase/citrate lyase family protein [Paenibacillus sp. P96]